MRTANELEQGIVLAANIVWKQHGEETVAFDILRECGLSQIDPLSIDDNDRPVLLAYQADVERRESNDPKFHR